MSPRTTRRIVVLTSQLAETLMTAALCAEEIRAAVLAELDGNGLEILDHSGAKLIPPKSNGQQRPILDESTMRVIWNGMTVHLGNTVAFRLLSRLSRRARRPATKS